MTRLAPALCSVTFRESRYDEVLSYAAEAQLAAIEWGADQHVPAGDLARAREVAAASRERDIAVASYGTYYEVGVAPVSEFERVRDTALALGAPGVRVWGGRRGVDSKDVPAEDREKIADALRSVCEIAQAARLTVSLEFHRQTLTDTLASTIDLLARTAHPALHSYWQPRGGIVLDEALAELEALRPHLSHLHVFNWDARRERFPLEAASALWQPLLQHVAAWPEAASPRWAMLEFVAGNAVAAFERDAATLRSWLRIANEKTAVSGSIA